MESATSKNPPEGGRGQVDWIKGLVLQELITTTQSLTDLLGELARSEDASLPGPEAVQHATEELQALISTFRSHAGPRAAKGHGHGEARRIVSSCVGRLMHRLYESNRRGLADAETAIAEPPVPEGLYGYSWSIPVPAVLGFLRSHGKTGTLRVSSRHEIFHIELFNGDVVHASSNNTPPGYRLGEILLAQKAVPLENLAAFLNTRMRGKARLGETLERQQLVSKEALRKALETQVQHLFTRLFEAQDCFFSFTEGVSELTDKRIQLNVDQLLLESARAFDERMSA